MSINENVNIKFSKVFAERIGVIEYAGELELLPSVLNAAIAYQYEGAPAEEVPTTKEGTDE